ncbi:MAG TPA: ABC transporter permease [Candidatus Angelobacter sp.]|jgi:osmoprotectant transport system permease protein|nr:ABC transporter permease [Candidatus Angelobacter sp.]
MPSGRARVWYLPIAVAVGIGLSVLVLQTLNPGPTDGEILNSQFLTDRLVRHIELVVIAFAVVAAIGLPVGVLMAKSGRFVQIPVFLVANLGQAVPSIGILVLFYAFFGLGLFPTLLALIVYALLPVLRNTLVGVQSVDPAAVEAARGMGMTAWQSLYRVELPLASPVIFAGLRTALVLIVGTATLGNFVGGGGLGDVIAAGINQSDRIVLVGAVMVAALALLADWALSLVERVVVPHRIAG